MKAERCKCNIRFLDLLNMKANTFRITDDFFGIFDKLKKALAFGSEDIKGTIEGLGILQKCFEELMAHGRNEFLPLCAGKVNDKAAEAVLEHFRDRGRRHHFYRYGQEIQELYEILSPDPHHGVADDRGAAESLITDREPVERLL
ncbi:MAG: hypothetical protein ACUVV5_12850 [Candidatus Aminicenantales bacterium]